MYPNHHKWFGYTLYFLKTEHVIVFGSFKYQGVNYINVFHLHKIQTTI